MHVNTSLQGTKIFVGLSGGVDSAVTAALLQRAGASVTGVFIKGWYPEGLPCTWAADRRDAMRVAAHLHIPFVTLDASKEYKQGVIDYLLREYRNGRTPNPDIMCNKEVKFGAFFDFAMKNGADYIATGHYARVTHEEDASLKRGVDPKKDQSYFLWAIRPEALQKTLFPLGGFEKPHVRKLAQEFSLPVKEKADSQGICFLGSISVDDFLRNEFGTRTGKIVSTEGVEVGEHDSVLLSTIGQRISAPNGPWYVVRKDIEKNELIVSHEHGEKSSEAIGLENVNWFKEPKSDETLIAQYRYHGPMIMGTYDAARAVFQPSAPMDEVPASGQSLVLYQGDVCSGGGIIS